MSLMGAFWRRIFSPFWRLVISRKAICIGRGSIFYGIPKIDTASGSRINLGSGSVLCSLSNYTALGVEKPCIIRAISSCAKISVGINCGFSGVVIVSAESVRIGNECLFGADVMVCDTDFHPLEPAGRRNAGEGGARKSVVIGNNVFVGARTTILKGAEIGDNSVIGAGSVVTNRIPQNVIAAGNPAKVLRELRVDESYSALEMDECQLNLG